MEITILVKESYDPSIKLGQNYLLETKLEGNNRIKIVNL